MHGSIRAIVLCLAAGCGGSSAVTIPPPPPMLPGSSVADTDGEGDVHGASGPEARGTLDSRHVVRGIQARMPAIKRCYQSQLRRNPSLRGKLTVELAIEERGRVAAARALENTTGSPAVADCVMVVLQKLHIDPGPEGGTVRFKYPFIFHPMGS